MPHFSFYHISIRRPGLAMPHLRQVPARKLRASFETMASRLGAPDRLLRSYMGHSPGDILGCHYRRIDMDELRAVSDAMNGWHEEAKRASLRKHSGNISISAKEAAEEAMC